MTSPIGEKGPAARRRPKEAREAYSLYVERAAEGANEAAGSSATIGKGWPITEEDRAFWAFQPLKRPAIPQFGSEDRVRTSIISPHTDLSCMCKRKERLTAERTESSEGTGWRL